ncbi:PAN2-PAN3 deadenylation complex subunit [Lachnellula willkommii]|uniref:PAN2-PAN3 deadenylation complex subunit n=1 Tax=Lachnellula willkommii TaxID=215461 RepID=A0A559M4J4_9HELO|nr:PAN2-PAN3 deadenylation complex subunit [Lachnellula willkommii]
MAAARFNSPELRKPVSSPRPKGREKDTGLPEYIENAKDTLCRNVLIYGHCRYEDQGCAFNHDPNKSISGQSEL